jgi:hypothetical protein
MEPKLVVASLLLVGSALFASARTAAAQGCNATKTDSSGTTCVLKQEGVSSCIYYNDSTHCSGGPAPAVPTDY